MNEPTFSEFALSHRRIRQQKSAVTRFGKVMVGRERVTQTQLPHLDKAGAVSKRVVVVGVLAKVHLWRLRNGQALPTPCGMQR